MSTQRYIRAIMKQVQDQFPELLTMTTGCQVRYLERTCVITNSHKRLDGSYALDIVCPGSSKEEAHSDEIEDILGHPIYWEHVFAMLCEKHQIGYAVSAEMTWLGKPLKDHVAVRWELHKLLQEWQVGKPLHRQSKFCIDFIYKLMKKKNGTD